MLILDKWKAIPRPVRVFLLKALVLFIVWKSVYLLFLLPGRVLDGPLTFAVGKGAAATLDFVTRSQSFTAKDAIRFEPEGRAHYYHVMEIDAGRQPALSIADVCNGLELIVLYIGFILCFPAKAWRRLVFIFTGASLIYLVNVARCAGLTLIYLHSPALLDFSHHYLFTFLVYGFVFFLWYIFTHKPVLTHVQAQS
ncbi:MAG: archaeosortase/exosortase family protein [Bacteroidota bacterium]|nr:archaeosortase/exosortase family protein [Bacteroidota bacterium]MDP4216673.1 archaeosortase/exosortase family protein [Bacteroidota bacterium]MDP4244223.1 archaeosortase/exosortase family protein [Bacteroidota bacterium]MDP4253405.1 archaeosortase/exosortase family protein [Bacteroidota bacterium]MDP4258883.1 archaeosortase/exosortase family protein [Bacteroidota bacterium]